MSYLSLIISVFGIYISTPAHDNRNERLLDYSSIGYILEAVKPYCYKEKYIIPFAVNTATLSKQAYVQLEKLIEYIKSNPDVRLIIEGHADKSGSRLKNKLLAQDRAEAVRDYILLNGICAERLTTIGKGSSVPIADNIASEGRNKNRRVDIYIK